MGSQGRYLLEHGGSTVFLEAGETLIGSDAQCAVRVVAEKVEPVHAAVLVADGKAVLQVRASAGDVAVNGAPVRVGELKAGDSVRFGEVELTLQGSGAAHLTLAGAKGTFALRVGENKVGRSPDNSVAIEDTSVSRNHAAILVLPSGMTRVRDLGSSNGTFINDRRLGERELAHGDKLELGGQQIVLLRAPDTGAPPPAARPAAKPTLELVLKGEARPLADGILRLGRSPDCEVPLPDDSLVSRYHAQIAVSGAQARLKDLGSSNGTRLNGEVLAAEVVLKDGDRIGIGGLELVFKATIPVDPMGATVIAQKVALPERTTLAPKGQAQVAATGREAALALLELPATASAEQIQKRYHELYSDFQVRLTNAPTPELKKKYGQRLDELRNAFELLAPAARPAPGAGDLPSPEPVAVPAGTPAAPAPAAAAPAAGAPAKPAPAAAAKGGIPAPTIVVSVLGLVAALVGAGFFVLWQASARVERAVQAEFDAKQQAIQTMQARVPQAQKELEALRAGRAVLIENKEFKICNLSSRELVVGWVHATWLGPDGQFESFDSAFHGYPTFRIAPGGTGKFEFVTGDQVLWDGSAVFFSVLLDYAGLEFFRSGGIPQLATDCFSVNLDQ
jgi:pSer/pThr/pTyr-binding forkhead associated (FHA) protein